jgi:hypothetical protein
MKRASITLIISVALLQLLPVSALGQMVLDPVYLRHTSPDTIQANPHSEWIGKAATIQARGDGTYQLSLGQFKQTGWGLEGYYKITFGDCILVRSTTVIPRDPALCSMCSADPNMCPYCNDRTVAALTTTDIPITFEYVNKAGETQAMLAAARTFVLIGIDGGTPTAMLDFDAANYKCVQAKWPFTMYGTGALGSGSTAPNAAGSTTTVGTTATTLATTK